LTAAAIGSTLIVMDMDDFVPKRTDDALSALAKQDLDPLSVDELHARVALLEAEILRTRNKIEHSVNHKASAEALFKK
jgi:uncharacterized small protein (DUF1192 family)